MKKLSSKDIVAIRKKLGHFSTEAPPTDYIDLGDEQANRVLGAEGLGIPFGRIMEIYGPEQSGKSVTCLDLLAEAQMLGAVGTWFDAETSWDPAWAKRRQVDVENTLVLAPYVGQFKKEKETRMSSAQESLAEVEAAIKLNHKNGAKKQIMVVDSVTALLTREEMEAGIAGQNMRTKLALPSFLGQLLRRWVGTAQSYNVLMIFINQLRINPAKLFGNPEYQPGGKALKFYSHIRVGARRVKGGRVMCGTKQLGIKGFLRNEKNKVGGLEFSEVGYHVNFSGDTEFMSVETVKKGK